MGWVGQRGSVSQGTPAAPGTLQPFGEHLLSWVASTSLTPRSLASLVGLRMDHPGLVTCDFALCMCIHSLQKLLSIGQFNHV